MFQFMPTAAKLVSAILLGALGWAAAHFIAGHLPEEVQHGKLRPVSAALGMLIGWRFLGRRVGGGMQTAYGLGLSAAAALVLSALFVFSFSEMIRRALRKSYKGPFEALQDVVQIALDNTIYLAHPDVIGTLVIGGVLVGVFAELTSRRWS